MYVNVNFIIPCDSKYRIVGKLYEARFSSKIQIFSPEVISAIMQCMSSESN